MLTSGPDGPPARTPQEVWAEWTAATEAEDVAVADRCAAELTEVAPDSYFAWFEASMHAKARRDWALSASRNERAMPLFGEAEAAELGNGDADPAAWNLGIAATALGDWERARRAWTAYGVAGLDGGAEPIDVDFGAVPIRVNPDQPSLSLQVLPEHGTTEVIWCWRRSPAHAVVASVPLPESGHRFRDVLLHDGQPTGTRQLGDQEVPVFNELERLHDSGLPTWQAEVEGTTPEDVRALNDLAGRRGLGVDDWSAMRFLCVACSHGSPGPGHSHAPAPTATTRLGLAGHAPDLSACLQEWTSTRSGVSVLTLDLLW